jgi:RHS repeat-associated protein
MNYQTTISGNLHTGQNPVNGTFESAGNTCADAYRFGFNAQEKDNEIYGLGNSYSAEFWQYDARIGRRWNIDPVDKAWESPYAAFRNNPLFFTDPDGKDGIGHIEERDGQKTLVIRATYFTNNRISQQTQEHVHNKMNAYKGKVFYKGERVNVEFQIEFALLPVDTKPEDVGGAAISDDFNEGLNTFNYIRDLQIEGAPAVGSGNRRGIEIDFQVGTQDLSNPDYVAAVMVEEIGHNIGFLHSDGGIMSVNFTRGTPTGKMTRYALQRFVNRLPEMTKAESSQSYWEASGEILENFEKRTGTTRINEDYSDEN